MKNERQKSKQSKVSPRQTPKTAGADQRQRYIKPPHKSSMQLNNDQSKEEAVKIIKKDA